VHNEDQRKTPEFSVNGKKFMAKVREINSRLDATLPPKEYAEEFMRAFAHDTFQHPGYTDLFCNLWLESDRGCVLVAAAMLDAELEGLLRDHFATRSVGSEKDVDFFFSGPMAPLLSTSLKIRLAFVLGLIDLSLKNALKQLQDLRSKVAAHSRERMILRSGQVGKILACLEGIGPAISAEEAKTADHVFCISDGFPGDLPGFSPKIAFALTSMVLLGAIEDTRKKTQRKQRRSSSSG
jgi:hypothetical protein